MASYSCFQCGKTIGENLLGKRVRCPYCGSKMLLKPHTRVTKVKAV